MATTGKTTMMVVPTEEGYRLSINGVDYTYRTIKDVQRHVAAHVWPAVDNPTIHITMRYGK